MEEEKKKYFEDLEKTLFDNRKLLLFGCIDPESAEQIVKEILYLDIKKKADITIIINNVGGFCDDGIAIIDAIQNARSKIITIISGFACSMASYISIVGNKRYMTRHSVWMAHEMVAGGEDYITKIYDRVHFDIKLNDMLTNIYKKYTHLTKQDIQKASNGELWYFAKDCLKKGIVDKII